MGIAELKGGRLTQNGVVPMPLIPFALQLKVVRIILREILNYLLEHVPLCSDGSAAPVEIIGMRLREQTLLERSFQLIPAQLQVAQGFMRSKDAHPHPRVELFLKRKIAQHVGLIVPILPPMSIPGNTHAAKPFC